MASDPEVAAFLADYIGLYTGATLVSWRELFLPGFVATAANEDGSVTTWTGDQFFERQRSAFATGKPIGEVLENPQVSRTGGLAFVRSDFVWTDGEITRRGQLMLLLIAVHRQLKIQALTFSCHG